MNHPSHIDHLLDIAALDGGAIPASARQMAKFSLFDWMVVARAGADQPLSRIIRELVLSEGGAGVASLAGSTTRVPARASALANGTISHALDYDDTHFAHVGHPSVGIMPSALAVAEQMEAGGSAVADAFLLGAEASCRIGMVLGRDHYQRGFHQTATAGAFGATVAAGRIYGLSRDRMRHALSLVSTRASGLKSQFGTMGKPFNAGISAANGVEAASLAKLGFISCDDGVAGPQGFIDTHSNEPDHEAAWRVPPPKQFIFEDIKYKFHACCHGTHAMIEALLEARRRHNLTPDRVSRIHLRTNPRWMRVCDIKEPRTGLEVKFSYVLLAAMVLHGIDTTSDATYTDALCGDKKLIELARRVAVTEDQAISDTAAEVSIEVQGSGLINIAHDLSKRLPSDELERGLRNKARSLLGDDVAERLWSAVRSLDDLSARDLGNLLRG